jgi:simple sugar transport system ATP-binding protein
VGEARLALSNISKRYGQTQANSDVSLAIAPGEVHALLGENGAGKSTLVKIIYGVVQPDSGAIAWEGRPVAIPDPNAARRLGIGMVFQHFSLFETLTAAENIALGLGSRERLAALSARITEVSTRYGLAVTPGRHVHHLSVGERQRVEIVRCLLGEPRLLIMDEPTSVLTPQEVQALFGVLRRLSAEGCSILYISHKLEEIRALCDAATVLRGGRRVGACVPRETSPAAMAELMTGAVLPETRRGASHPGAAMLEVTGLSLPADEPFGTSLRDVSLTVRAGEIVGVAGVSGNGQKELLAALSGERPARDAASVRLGGAPAGGARPAERRRMGLAFVPEERLGRGAVAEMSLADNALLTCYQNGLAARGWLRPAVIRRYAAEVIRRFRVKAEGVRARASSLSGGNMQKFIIGREVGTEPRLLLAAHPTWGVDIGASLSIRQELLDLAASGTAILVVSEDLPELFEICDRVAVLFEGTLSPALPVAGLTLEAVGLMMGGHAATQAPERADAA